VTEVRCIFFTLIVCMYVCVCLRVLFLAMFSCLRIGESVLTWKADAVVIDVLINACVHTVENKLLQFAKADSNYRFLLYAGHVIAETGNWLLQDGTLSFQSFVKVFGTGCGGTGPIDVATYAEGNWGAGGLAKFAKRVRLNPEKSSTSGSGADASGFTKFASVVASHITIETTQQLLQGTDVIGVVPFSRPTINIFQGGNGMSALFGVRGFNMLVDTGFPRRTCCWDFIRHIGHIDVVILPQVGESNVLGARSFVERLAVGDVQTAVGQVFINAGKVSAAGKTASSDASEAATGDSSAVEQPDSLLSLNEVSVSVVECLEKSRIPCAPCVTKLPPQAINLYHKIGFGSLDMYVLNPVADTKDLKDFLASWGKTSKSRGSKLNDLVSISTLVAFRPQTQGDRPVRILFPGSCPVGKLYEGLDRLKTNSLFQTADGCERPAVRKSAGDKGTARPGAGSGKPGTARPASTPSTVSSKTLTTKAGSRAAATETSTSAAKSKKTASESAAAKTQDQKARRDAKADPKSDAADQKDAKAHPSTSTPKRDAQKASAPKNDASAAKRGTVPPANKTHAKTMPSPIGKKMQSPRRNDEKSADTQAEVPAADEPVVKPDDGAASDSQADVIPELVSCTSKQDTPKVESQGDSHLVTSVSDSAPAGESETAGTATGSDEKVASTAVESAGDRAPPAGVEVDPTQSWDAPQSSQAKMPRRNDEKSADVPAEVPAVDEPVVKPDDGAASEGQADVIPELVSCTTEQDTPKVESQVVTEQGESHLVASGSDSGPVGESGTATGSDEKVPDADASAAVESAGDQAPPAGVEVDPTQLWDAPQGLPAPSDDKAVGSMLSDTDRRGAKDHASATAGKRTDRSSHPPPSARSATSAASASKKAAPMRATTPFYVDLAYVPTYAVDGCDAEFFRRVRARYYIIPGSSADAHLLSMLADAKSAWEGDVTVIPTGNTDALITWVMAHRDELASLKIEVTPSVARSTLHLDRGSSCSAYRLEF